MTLIILVNPKGGPWISDESLGLDYIASALDRQGENVSIINLHQCDVSELICLLEIEQVTYVGITMMHSTTTSALQVASIVKSTRPTVPVVVGGVTATTSWQELLQNANIDIAVVGEGEITATKIISACRGEISLKDIPGIAFRCNGVPMLTDAPPRIDDLDSLAWPKRVPGRNSYSILTSRGCPGYCIYCSSPTLMGRNYRARSVTSVLSELEYIFSITAHRPLEIIVADDNFSHDVERAILICKGITDRHLDINLTVGNGIRVDKVNRELLVALKNAGCHFLAFGVESGCQQILDKIAKGITLEQIRNAFLLAKDIGVPALANLMIGNIAETEETVESTIMFCKEIDPDYVSWNIAVDYPGTAFYQWVSKHGKRLPNRKNVVHTDSRYVAFDTEVLPVKKRKQLRRKALHSFYWQRVSSILRGNRPIWNALRLLGTINIHSSNRILKQIVVSGFSFLERFNTN